MGRDNNNTSQREWKHLTEKERYKIEALLRRGLPPSVIGAKLGRDRRTIEREIARGSAIQRDRNWEDKLIYRADAGQRVHEERSAKKGRGLKIGHDHKLAEHIVDKIKNEKWSPDVVIGRIKAEGLKFETSICTKTLYNYIDKGIFAGLSNKNLCVKKDGKKRNYKKIRTVALNNKNGN